MIAWLLIGGGGVLAVVAMAVGLARSADRYLPQHALNDPAENRPALYGSMILAEERTFLLPAPGPLEAPLRPDWREQTAADLSPEALGCECEHPLSAAHPDYCPALDGEVMPHAEDEWSIQSGSHSGPHVSSGPGDLSSLDPGPDRFPIRGDVQGWAGGCAPSESRPAARADLTGSLSPRHQKEDPGSLAHGEPGLERLGESEPCGVTAPPAPAQSRALTQGSTASPDNVAPDHRGPGWPVNGAPEPSRLLKTTGEIMRAETFADVCAFMSRQDALTIQIKAGYVRDRIKYCLDLAEALA